MPPDNCPTARDHATHRRRRAIICVHLRITPAEFDEQAAAGAITYDDALDLCDAIAFTTGAPVSRYLHAEAIAAREKLVRETRAKLDQCANLLSHANALPPPASCTPEQYETYKIQLAEAITKYQRKLADIAA